MFAERKNVHRKKWRKKRPNEKRETTECSTFKQNASLISESDEKGRTQVFRVKSTNQVNKSATFHEQKLDLSMGARLWRLENSLGRFTWIDSVLFDECTTCFCLSSVLLTFVCVFWRIFRSFACLSFGLTMIFFLRLVFLFQTVTFFSVTRFDSNFEGDEIACFCVSAYFDFFEQIRVEISHTSHLFLIFFPFDSNIWQNFTFSKENSFTLALAEKKSCK